LSQTYFNHYSYIAHNWWGRTSFVSSWWQIYKGDPYWVPPYYPTFRRVLEPSQDRHLARMKPLFVHTEALPGRKRQTQASSAWNAPLFGQPVAAAVILCDLRRQDGTAYLALLQSVNDAGSLARLLGYMAEAPLPGGCRNVIGPIGLSPHFGSGLLQDYWNEIPPLHTPYNPPYMPETIGSVMRARSGSRLYHLEIPREPSSPPPARAEFTPFNPARLCGDLLPLLVAACPPQLNFAPPDAEEAEFLLRWINPWPLISWLAQIDSQPLGFILLQPDLAHRLRRAEGGRNPIWRLWLAWAGCRPTRQGRVLFAGVLPAWRKQGIGRQLLHQAMLTAQQQGWRRLSIGPLPGTAPGSRFLEHCGAQARQSYLIYQQEL